jgi:hypothetical protein
MTAHGYVEREVGLFPISIGTSYALQGFLGNHPNQPQQPAASKNVRAMYINLRTMIRNLYAAMPSAAAQVINHDMAAITLLEECRSIPDILRQHKHPCEVVYYFSNLDEVKWVFPKAEYKKARTEKQIHYEVYEKLVLTMLLAQLKEAHVDVEFMTRQPKPSPVIAAIITHYPTELLWRQSFERLLLLESHTGKLKMYNTWFTKLEGITEQHPMPFNKYTLQVFGEGVLFAPQPKPIRDALKQLAEYKRWTGITTDMKVHADISASGDRALKENYALLNR